MILSNREDERDRLYSIASDQAPIIHVETSEIDDARPVRSLDRPSLLRILKRAAHARKKKTRDREGALRDPKSRKTYLMELSKRATKSWAGLERLRLRDTVMAIAQHLLAIHEQGGGRMVGGGSRRLGESSGFREESRRNRRHGQFYGRDSSNCDSDAIIVSAKARRDA